MLWLKTGVLSDKEINRLLGKKIFIWPFDKNNLKGSTYNLTASYVAIKASDKTSLLNDKDEIVIPSGETALIQTDESIYVTEDICGTYHSKVKLVTNGLSHIGTTLDPCYFGTSLIAIHNHSKEEQKIKVGSTFASLMLYKIPKSSKPRHDNQPFRNDLIDTRVTSFNMCAGNNEKIELYKEKIEEWYSENWRRNKEELIDEVKKYVKKRDENKFIHRVDTIRNIVYSIIIIIIIFISFKLIPTTKAPEYIGWFTLVTALILPFLNYLSNYIKDRLRGE